MPPRSCHVRPDRQAGRGSRRDDRRVRRRRRVHQRRRVHRDHAQHRRRDHWDDRRNRPRGRWERQGRRDRDLPHRGRPADREHRPDASAEEALFRGWGAGRRARPEPVGPCRCRCRRGCCPDGDLRGDPCRCPCRTGCCPDADLPGAPRGRHRRPERRVRWGPPWRRAPAAVRRRLLARRPGRPGRPRRAAPVRPAAAQEPARQQPASPSWLRSSWREPGTRWARRPAWPRAACAPPAPRLWMKLTLRTHRVPAAWQGLPCWKPRAPSRAHGPEPSTRLSCLGPGRVLRTVSASDTRSCSRAHGVFILELPIRSFR